jgi:hypothetical protein
VTLFLLGVALAGTWRLVRHAGRMVERTAGPAGPYCRHHVGRPRPMVLPVELYDYESELS